jgi:TonB-linked SusC/RagA family outer membrane protein
MRQKLLFCFLLLMSLTIFGAYAQTRNISGKVTDSDTGQGLPGVSVFLKGTSSGTVTDVDGRFIISANEGNTLVFQSVGMITQEVVVGASSTIELAMTTDTKQLGEVVVTALGVSREERSLGYAVQEVKGAELTNVGQSNFVNALSGKVSGVQIIGTSGAAIGGSQKIRLRGVTSLGSNDSPLIVIDGTPIDNSTSAAGDWRGGRDYGNLAGDINPNDIENINVLKGPSAAALYGQRGANGVIMITTKKGTTQKGIGVEFNHNTTFERVYVLPEYQNEYAGGYDQDFIPFEYDPTRHPASWASFNGQPMLNYEADESWGPRMDGRLVRQWDSWHQGDNFGKLTPLTPQPNNIRNFFDTGTTFTNNLSFTGGNDKSTFRLSVGIVDTKGVLPGSKLTKNNLGFNGSTKLTDKLSVNANINYAFIKAKGRPASGYTSQSVITSFNQWFHREINMDDLRNYKNPDGTYRPWNILSPNSYDPNDPEAFRRPLYWNNPYFEVFENAGGDKRERVYGNIGITYQLLSNPTKQIVYFLGIILF